MLSLPVLIVLFFIGGFLYLSHNTNPKSLNFSIEQEASPDYHYNLSGKWNERIDYYSFGTDFVAICTKDNKKVKMTKYNKGDWKPNYYNFGTDIPYQIRKNANISESCVPQLFDIKVQKDFSMSFQVETQKEKEPVTVYYVHIRMDPMSSPSYWVKKISY